MVEQIVSWRASDGSVHETHLAALRHELYSLFVGIVENEPLARRMVTAVTPALAGELSVLIAAIGEEIAS